MYPDDFIGQVQRQRDAMIRLAAAILVLSLAVSILVGVFVDNTAGIVLLSLGICAFIAYWGLRGSQVWAYHQFVREIMLGRHREIEAEVVRVSAEPVYKDNKLYYYEIDTRQGELERMLLWDANFPLPDIRPGQKLRFIVMDRYIWGIVQ